MVQSNTLKKVLIIIVVLAVYVICFFQYTKPDITYTQSYTGQVGNVDKEYFERINENYKIMADVNGKAIFENPRKAMITLYLNNLPTIFSMHFRGDIIGPLFFYRCTIDSSLNSESARFVEKFMDIYSNSFYNK